jgi:hypothetical protein
MAKGRFFPVQTVDTGPKGNIGTMLKPLSAKGPWKGQLGSVTEAEGKLWRLVQLDYDGSAVDTIDGGLLYWEDRSLFTVHTDASAGEALAQGVAGGCHQVVDVSALTEDQYLWVQVGGDQAAVVVAASAVAGDPLSGHASTDNVLTRTAAGTAAVNLQVGVCLSTRGTTTSDESASVANSAKVRWVIGNML